MTAGLWHRWTHPAQGEDLLSPPTLHLGGDERCVVWLPFPPLHSGRAAMAEDWLQGPHPYVPGEVLLARMRPSQSLGICTQVLISDPQPPAPFETGSITASH